MNNDINVQIVDDMMGAITQTEAWLTEHKKNPAILAAQKQLSKALEPIKGVVPDDVIDMIEEAAYSYGGVVETTAILYGIHVADAIRDVAARPSDLTRHILARTGGTV